MADYITLASDSSIDIFPENRIGSFRCKLPKKIYLDRKRHQIGLKHISWPHKTNNIEDGTFKIRLSVPPSRERLITSGMPLIIDEDGNRWNDDISTISDLALPNHTTGESVTPTTRPPPPPSPHQHHQETRNASISAGYYVSPQDAVHAMNLAIRKTLTRTSRNETFANLDAGLVRFEYDRTTDVVSCKVREDAPCKVRIILSKELFVKFGFGLSHDRARSIAPPETAAHTTDLDLGKNAIFVYSDILELNRLVGNKMHPLLAIVPFKGERGKVVNHEPNSVEYCDLRFDSFDEIKIDLVGDTGEILKFLSGKVFVTLHIKDKFA